MHARRFRLMAVVFVRNAVGWRRMLAVTLVAAIAAASVPGHAQGPVDAAFLSAEFTDELQREMPKIVDHAIAYDQQLTNTGRPTPQERLDRLRASATNIFDARWMAAIVARVPAAPAGGVKETARFVQATARLRAADAALKPPAPDQYEAFEKTMTARYAARPDKAVIDRLSSAMALPELAAERGRTMAGVADMLERLRAGMSAEMRAADEATIRREVAKASLRLALLDLSPADVAALLAFYESPVGRAKRSALVTAFAAASDGAFRIIATDMILEARRETSRQPSAE